MSYDGHVFEGMLFDSHYLKGKQVCDPYAKWQNVKEKNEDKYWVYFTKINSMSPMIMVAWLK
jgi:hypothetical protein